jgi:Na+-translocating ferredoxin:NAD+ oxidoreductase subunit G
MLKMIKPTVVLFLTCVIVTGLLALTYSSTKDIIRQREEEVLRQARETVLKEAQIFEKADEVLYVDESMIEDIQIGKTTEGEIVGVVINVIPKGYANVIKMSVGIKTDGTIEAIAVIEHEETPGLGARIEEEPFMPQFTELKAQNDLMLVKTGRSKDEEIQAISGATISSEAVVQGVNAAKRLAMKIITKAGDEN